MSDESEIQIVPYQEGMHDRVIELSMAAWAPVFEGMRPETPDYVYEAFYPDGWRARQTEDVSALLKSDPDSVWIAELGDDVVGFIGVQQHPEDGMGVIHIIASHPKHQRKGVARSLIEFAMDQMRDAGLSMVMVETGGDSGHASARATYEGVGFELTPIARYFKEL
jgi:ribosomal protein S18 acetylase RimI-like enzyme